MFIIFLVSIIWIILTNQYGVESYIILFFLDLGLVLIKAKLSTENTYPLKKNLILTFFFSFFISFYSAFKITIMMLFGRLYRGIYEVHIEDVSRMDQFFLSTSITIVPNTIYLDRIGDAFLIHKLAANEKEAHVPEKILFLTDTQ